MPESTATLSVEAAGQVYNQRNEFVHLGEKPQCRPVHRGQPLHTQRIEVTLEVYDRPSAPLEFKIRMLRAEIIETMLYGCVAWRPCACHYATLRRAHHSFLTRCIGWRKNNRADHPIPYLDTLIKTGSESIDATLPKRQILFAGFVARLECTILPKWVMFGELVRGQENEWMMMGCLLDDLRAFDIKADQWDDCSPGRGEMAQAGGTRGGTFHSEMDRCRECRGWTTACSSMPERDGKDQGEDNPKQAGSGWFARPC